MGPPNPIVAIQTSATLGPTQNNLLCSVNSLRFLSFLLWFVLGPGGLREASEGPGKAHGELRGASRGPPGLPRARFKKPKNLYFLQGPTERPSNA